MYCFFVLHSSSVPLYIQKRAARPVITIIFDAAAALYSLAHYQLGSRGMIILRIPKMKGEEERILTWCIN